MENTRRHELPTDLARALSDTRVYRRLGLRATAREVGISAGYLSLLEQGKRCPSVDVARRLATTLELAPFWAERLRAVAQPDAGYSRARASR